MKLKEAYYLIQKYNPKPIKRGLYKINLKELGIKRPSMSTLRRISTAFNMIRNKN